MDYSLKQDGFELLVEAEKERVKEEILSSYINLRKKKGRKWQNWEQEYHLILWILCAIIK